MIKMKQICRILVISCGFISSCVSLKVTKTQNGQVNWMESIPLPTEQESLIQSSASQSISTELRPS